jgi:hypothetical protein
VQLYQLGVDGVFSDFAVEPVTMAVLVERSILMAFPFTVGLG